MERFYMGCVILVACSTMSTCFLAPRDQSAPEAFLPLVIMWGWLSLVGAIGIVPVLRGTRARRALVALRLVMTCTVASTIVDYWILSILAPHDLAHLNGLVEFITDGLYLLLVISCVAAPWLVTIVFARPAAQREKKLG